MTFNITKLFTKFTFLHCLGAICCYKFSLPVCYTAKDFTFDI